MRSLVKLGIGAFSIALFLAFSFTNLYSQTARVQVIHNSADVAASNVDIYLGETLLLDDFAFRTASPFIDAPAETPITISVAPATSTSSTDAIANFNFNLEANKTYVIIANGVLDNSKYSENPDNQEINFDLIVNDMARESAEDQNNVEFFVLHGATDAPAVDIYARDAAKLVSNAKYKDFTEYISVPAAKYTLDITPANDENTIVTSLDADLTSLKGGSAVVFASGFLDPSSNENGAAFAVLAALPDGTVITLNPVSNSETARVQIIHNSPDKNAAVVDIYLDETLLLNDFAFRAASPFIDAPAETDFQIGVAPANSTSSDDAIAKFDFNLEANKTYVVVASGVLDTLKYKKNPNAIKIGFELIVNDMARESAENQDNVEFFVLHGSTDAPEVDIYARGVAKLVSKAKYKDFTDYISVPASNYILDITPGDDPNTIVTSLTADLSTLQGGSAVVFASGFLDPASNDNGAGFAVLAALPDGNVVSLNPVTNVEEDKAFIPEKFELMQNYPNPFNPVTSISYSIPSAGAVELKVYNLLGKEVVALVNEYQEAGNYRIDFDASNLSSGVYLYTINAGTFNLTKKLMLLK